MDAKRLRAELRVAFANYAATEGCGCCGNREKHEEAEAHMCRLLNIPKYEDGSGYNVSKYSSIYGRKAP